MRNIDIKVVKKAQSESTSNIGTSSINLPAISAVIRLPGTNEDIVINNVIGEAVEKIKNITGSNYFDNITDIVAVNSGGQFYGQAQSTNPHTILIDINRIIDEFQGNVSSQLSSVPENSELNREAIVVEIQKELIKQIAKVEGHEVAHLRDFQELIEQGGDLSSAPEAHGPAEEEKINW